jgi:hypothetical protein
MSLIFSWRRFLRRNEVERGQVRRRLRTFRPTVFDLEERVTPAIHVTTTLDETNGKDSVISLREAITIENAGGDPTHTIILDRAGIYKITIPGPGENGNATGDFDISTNNLTIQGGAAGDQPRHVHRGRQRHGHRRPRLRHQPGHPGRGQHRLPRPHHPERGAAGGAG